MLLYQQLLGLTVMILVGAAGAIGYDFYRALRQIFVWQKKGTFIGDLLYSLLFLVLFLFFLWPINSGQLRSYVYLGLFLGYAGYFAFLHKWCYRLIARLAYLLAMILRFMGRILAFPFRLIGKIVIKPLVVLIHLIKAFFLRWYKKWQDNRQKVGEDLSENL